MSQTADLGAGVTGRGAGAEEFQGTVSRWRQPAIGPAHEVGGPPVRLPLEVRIDEPWQTHATDDGDVTGRMQAHL